MKTNFPDDDWEKKMQDALDIITSLNQQVNDRILKHQGDAKQIQINPASTDPYDIMFRAMQSDIAHNQEDNRIQANALNAVTTGLFLANSKIRELEKEIKKLKKKK